jgi:uncharacterized membrane protein YqjE
MGILSFTGILLSLACLAIMIGLVFVVILVWPHKTQDNTEGEAHESGRSERESGDQE